MNKEKQLLKQATNFLKIQEQEPCYHPYLLIKKKTGEKVCASCGRTIYRLAAGK